MRQFSVILVVMVLGVVSAFGGPISDIGLFSSGVNSSGAVLGSGSDPHYLFNGSNVPVVATTGIPSSPGFAWLAANSSSAWIAPVADVASMTTTTDTVYTYTTTFNLTGYDLSTVVITGSWAVDNFGTVYLNSSSGSPINTIPGDGSPTAYNSLHAFTINSGSAGLIAGVNTLVFATTNQHFSGGDKGNPGGVRAQFASTFEGSLAQNGEIPEPGTLALLGGGLLALGLFRRRMVR